MNDNNNNDRMRVAGITVGILNNEAIEKALTALKGESEEEKMAIEFINSYLQFLKQIVENDLKKGINRSGIEIKDLISNANVLLREKDNYIFTTMVINSANHYKSIKDKSQKQKNGKDS